MVVLLGRQRFGSGNGFVGPPVQSASLQAVGEQGAHARGESLVVRHAYSRSVRGRPKERNTLVSGKPVIATIRLPLRVSTMSPYAWATGAGCLFRSNPRPAWRLP